VTGAVAPQPRLDYIYEDLKMPDLIRHLIANEALDYVRQDSAELSPADQWKKEVSQKWKRPLSSTRTASGSHQYGLASPGKTIEKTAQEAAYGKSNPLDTEREDEEAKEQADGAYDALTMGDDQRRKDSLATLSTKMRAKSQQPLSFNRDTVLAKRAKR
jgi:hypothetical protein